MDKKVYEKTRYQNIYRHKKNKNYVISISKPVKTSISSIDGKKIFKLEEALNIRDNKKIKFIKGTEAKYKDNFDDVWGEYIYSCKNVKKLAYNTISRKEKMYRKYLKNAFNKRISKITKQDMVTFINNMNSTKKQKNEMLRCLKAFFNWCIKEERLVLSPVANILPYKVEKQEMKYWTPKELSQFLNALETDISSKVYIDVARAMQIKIFTLIQFSLGDRVGETRALSYDCFDTVKKTVSIKHSINYDTKSNDFLSNTKTYGSQRTIVISDKLIDVVQEYKNFLVENTDYDIKDTDLIFFNYSTKRPYSDITLRKKFYYYCDKANVTRIRMYDLRHTYVATMMAEGKELYHISERLGHKNYSTTVNKYGHLSHEVKRELAEVTDKYI